MAMMSGLDIIYLFRFKGEVGHAWKLAYQTEGSTSEVRNYETTITKDGAEKRPAAYEATHSISAVLAEDDVYVRRLRQNLRKDKPEELEVWEIHKANVGEEETIPGEYSIDVVTSADPSAGAEGDVEVAIETEVNGKIYSGEVEVTPQLLEILQEIKEETEEFKQPTETGSE